MSFMKTRNGEIYSKDKILDLWYKILKGKSRDLNTAIKQTKRIFEWVLPNKSISLTTNYYNNVSKIDNDLLLILISHLYLERCLDEIIKNKSTRSRKLLNESFYKKVKSLNELGEVNGSLFRDILIINQLRNRFVHKLDYELQIDDLKNLTQISEHIKLLYENHKRMRSSILRHLMKFQLIFMMEELSKKHRFLYLINV